MVAKKKIEPVADAPVVVEVEGGKEVTLDGVTFKIMNAAFKDHRVVQKLAKIRRDSTPINEKIILNGELIDRILGEAQADILVDALADENGFTDAMVMAEKFTQILGAAFPNS